MISPERLDLHQQSWVRLLAHYGVAPADAYPVFDQLVTAYSEPHRHYHNLEHISEMLKVAGRLADQGRDARAVQLAIWFHDAVYDPTAKDNEEQSAALAESSLRPLGLTDELLGRIAGMILATKHASASADDPDTAILLDADLAILGAEEKRYARYATAIRAEYAWVDDAAYRSGRAAVLQAFLRRERIYVTQRMFETGEVAARQNMQGELMRLAD